MEKSLTGLAVQSQEAQTSVDVTNDSRVFKQHPFLEQAKIRTMCSLPLTLHGERKAALNLYRTVPIPFSEEEVLVAIRLVSVVPPLYRSIAEQISFRLTRDVNAILQGADSGGHAAPLGDQEVRQVFGGICDLVARTFLCLEASLFLEDRLKATGRYDLMATTWPWPDSFKTRTYKKGQRGLTGWVVQHGKPVRIFDLGNFDRDRELIREDYPGLNWRDSLRIRAAVRRHLELPETADLPPISFMAVPLLRGDDVIGVIRCSAHTKGPFFFTDEELGVLQLLAGQISQYWTSRLNRRELQEENESWRRLVRSVRTLNAFVHDELMRDAPSESRIFAKALKVTGSTIAGAEIMDVRLLDEERKYLRFVETAGSAWVGGDPAENNRRRNRLFPVGKEGKSAGAHVCATGETYVIHDVHTDDYYSETFPSTTRMIVAPIVVGDRMFGVLDMRATGPQPFRLHAALVADLLGRQLGLYLYLATIIRDLRKAEGVARERLEQLERLQGEQAQTYQDLAHQLKTPIIQVHARVQTALSVSGTRTPPDELTRNLYALRGLSGKAKRVTMSTGLFAQLARGSVIRLNQRRLLWDDLIKMLIEASRDNEILLDPARRVSFRVDRESFAILRTAEVLADPDLLEQAINNLLDNAAKYSYEGTSVRIEGGTTHKGRFQVTVSNRGIRLRPEQVARCIQRGWRSDEAVLTTGEGSGIGLWIVDNIMRAHDGELVIVPTRLPEGVTEVKLVFPVSRAR